MKLTTSTGGGPKNDSKSILCRSVLSGTVVMSLGLCVSPGTVVLSGCCGFSYEGE